jgi:polyisoprenoid-binding protein YceI
MSWRSRLLAGGVAAALCLAPAWSRGQDAPASGPAAETTAAPAPANQLDPAHSRFGFELRTRFGQHVTGNFPRYEGSITTLPDGRRQVRIRLASQSVEVTGSERYARFARGPNFLDAARHPWVEFVSEPYVGELVHAGGPLRGTLSLHGVSRAETFVLKPAACARPAHDCDVVAYGRVDRTDYGLRSWRWAVQDEVRFTLRVRWLETPK